jgi:lipopolysaccharide/colanic/teichoic acid biosynthesis glycosyltransferase
VLPECAEVKDSHTAAPGLDYLKRAQELERLADGLARGTDPAGHVLDRVAAAVALLLLSPLLAGLALAVRLSPPRSGPVPPAAHRPRRA